MLLECLFSVYSMRQLLPKEKLFFQNYMTNVVKIDKIREELFQDPILRRHCKNWNLSSGNFLLKNGPRIKDEEHHDKEQNIYTNSFHFYVLKKLSKHFFINF